MAKKGKPNISHSFLKIVPDYINKNGQFPSRDIDPASKGEAYCREWAKGIYAMYLNDRTSWGATAFDYMNKMRLYAVGDQPVEQYQKSLLGDDDSNPNAVLDMPISRVASKEGWMNVLWKPLSLAPKLINNVLGMMEGVDFDIYVSAIDSNSRDLEETAKAKALVLSMNKDFLTQYKRNAGIPTDEEQSVPDNPYEIEMIERMDGFKVNYAKNMQKLVRHSMNISKWDDVLYKKLVTDLLVCRRAVTRDYYDHEEKKFKTKYVDVARAGVQYSNDLDFSDAEYAYYCDLMTISEIRVVMPHISEKELWSIAEANLGLFGNPSYVNNPQALLNDPSTTIDDFPWNNFYISVFDTEWMDFDGYRAQEYRNVFGAERYIPLGYTEPLPEPSARQKRKGVTIRESRTVIRQPYQCKWIVGTDYVFDCGKTHFAARPQPSKPKLSFNFEQLLEPSLIEQTYPILDQFQITWYRYQNLRAQAIESGFAVDFGMLINLTDGEGKKYPLNEILQMWKQTGILGFMPSRYGSYAGGAVTPVTPLPNNLLIGIQGIQADFQLQFMLFEQVTGINPVALGQSPNPEAPVATTEAALQSTINVLKPVITAVREIKENIAVGLMSKLQAGIKAEKDIAKSYELVVGKSGMSYILDAEKESVQYGMKMEAKPDQLFKQSIAKYIQIALQNGRDGKAGVDLPEAMYLEESLLRGEDVTQIRQNLTFFLTKSKKEQERREKENIQLQQQGLAQLEQMKMQGKQQDAQLNGMTLQMQEQERRKTERMKENYNFLNGLIQALQDETKVNMINPDTARRLKLAMQVAGGADLSVVDLPTAVAQMERAMGFSSPAQMPQVNAAQPPQPGFQPVSNPNESVV